MEAFLKTSLEYFTKNIEERERGANICTEVRGPY